MKRHRTKRNNHFSEFSHHSSFLALVGLLDRFLNLITMFEPRVGGSGNSWITHYDFRLGNQKTKQTFVNGIITKTFV
jgi:hypothetical protein